MKNSYLLILLVSSFFCNSGKAQEFVNNKLIAQHKAGNNELLTKYKDKIKDGLETKYLNIKGTYYLDEGFVAAKIHNIEGVLPVRYNAFMDEMEVQTKDGSKYLKKDFSTFVTFLDSEKIYSIAQYIEKDLTTSGYFVVLSHNELRKISLLLKEQIVLLEEVKAKTSYNKNKPPTLKRIKDKLYVSLNGNPAMKLPKKKKDVLKVFSKNAKQVESFAKENKLSFSKKDDLVKIFEHYGSL